MWAQVHVRGLHRAQHAGDLWFWTKLFLMSSVVLTTSFKIHLLAHFESAPLRNWTNDWDDLMGVSGSAISSVDEALTNVNSFVDHYFELQHQSVKRFVYVDDKERGVWDVDVPKDVRLTLERFDRSPAVDVHHLSRDDRGLLDTSSRAELVELIKVLKEIRLRAELITFEFTYERLCWNWDIEYVISFENLGQRKGGIRASRAVCRESQRALASSSTREFMASLAYMTVVFSSLSVLFILWENRVLHLLLPPKSNRALGSLSALRAWRVHWRTTRVRWGPWQTAELVGQIVNIIGSVLMVEYVNEGGLRDHQSIRLWLGLGCLMAWTFVIDIVEGFGGEWGSFISVMKATGPVISRIVLGSMPVYLGFTFFGVSMFARPGNSFRDAGKTAETLFAVLNGDALLDFFNEADAIRPFWGNLWLYSFSVLFILILLNVVLVVVETQYFTVVPMWMSDDQRAELNTRLEPAAATAAAAPARASAAKAADAFADRNGVDSLASAADRRAERLFGASVGLGAAADLDAQQETRRVDSLVAEAMEGFRALKTSVCTQVAMDRPERRQEVFSFSPRVNRRSVAEGGPPAPLAPAAASPAAAAVSSVELQQLLRRVLEEHLAESAVKIDATLTRLSV